MKRKQYLKILDAKYEVHFIDNSEWEGILGKRIEGLNDTSGYIDTAEQMIFISSNSKPDRARTTLLHEVFHAIYANTFDRLHNDLDPEEAITEYTTSHLMQVINNNSWFADYLVEGRWD